MCGTLVRAAAGCPPSSVGDLSVNGPGALDQDSLVVAGQALTWQSVFSYGPLTAVPVSSTSALLVRHDGEAGPEQWHDRFALGLAHRMKGELSIAAVTARLLTEAVDGYSREDAELLTSAIDGFTALLADLEVVSAPEDIAEWIVADALRTHTVLLGDGLVHQQVSSQEYGEFTIRTVRSDSAHRTRSELERLRTQVGLPWPTRPKNGVGRDLGMARWRSTVQGHRHQMWCRVEGKNALVTELWLRNPEEPRG
jgi:hypothetical protein